MNNLPNDITSHHIFNYLTSEDISNLNLVSKSMKNQVDSNKTLLNQKISKLTSKSLSVHGNLIKIEKKIKLLQEEIKKNENLLDQNKPTIHDFSLDNIANKISLYVHQALFRKSESNPLTKDESFSQKINEQNLELEKLDKERSVFDQEADLIRKKLNQAINKRR